MIELTDDCQEVVVSDLICLSAKADLAKSERKACKDLPQRQELVHLFFMFRHRTRLVDRSRQHQGISSLQRYILDPILIRRLAKSLHDSRTDAGGKTMFRPSCRCCESRRVTLEATFVSISMQWSTLCRSSKYKREVEEVRIALHH
jgi:hypothetical protein